MRGGRVMKGERGKRLCFEHQPDDLACEAAERSRNGSTPNWSGVIFGEESRKRIGL
jgi:hypothetical protein